MGKKICVLSGQNAERGGSPLVSFSRVIDPHFVTFSSCLYTTIRSPNPIHNPNSNPSPNPNPHPNPSPNPNRNPTVITDPQIGPIDPQIVIVQIRPTPHFVACRFYHRNFFRLSFVSSWILNVNHA